MAEFVPRPLRAREGVANEDREDLERMVRTIGQLFDIIVTQHERSKKGGYKPDTEEEGAEAHIQKVWQTVADMVHGRDAAIYASSRELSFTTGQRGGSTVNWFDRSISCQNFVDVCQSITHVTFPETTLTGLNDKQLTGVEGWLRQGGAQSASAKLIMKDKGSVGGVRWNVGIRTEFQVPLERLTSSLLQVATRHGADIRSDQQRAADHQAAETERLRVQGIEDEAIAKEFGSVFSLIQEHGIVDHLSRVDNDGVTLLVECEFYTPDRKMDHMIVTKNIGTGDITFHVTNPSSGKHDAPDWLKLDQIRPPERVEFDRLMAAIVDSKRVLAYTSDTSLVVQKAINDSSSVDWARPDETRSRHLPRLREIAAILQPVADEAKRVTAAREAVAAIESARQNEVESQPRTVSIIARDDSGWVSQTRIFIDPSWSAINCTFNTILHQPSTGLRSYPTIDPHRNAIGKQFKNRRGFAATEKDQYFQLRKVGKVENISVDIHCYAPGTSEEKSLRPLLGDTWSQASTTTGTMPELAAPVQVTQSEFVIAPAVVPVTSRVERRLPEAAVVQPAAIQREAPPEAAELDPAAAEVVVQDARLYQAIAQHCIQLVANNSAIDRGWAGLASGVVGTMQRIIQRAESHQPLRVTDQTDCARAPAIITNLFSREKQFTSALAADYKGQVDRWRQQWTGLSDAVGKNATAADGIGLMGYDRVNIMNNVQQVFLQRVASGERVFDTDQLITTVVDMM